MKTSAQRIAKYNARMLSSLIDPVLSAGSVQQQANYAAYANVFTPKQEALRVLLDAAGVDSSQYIFYEAYSAELYHAWKTASGASLIITATAIQGRWAHASRLGAGAAALLKSIALSVYAITIP